MAETEVPLEGMDCKECTDRLGCLISDDEERVDRCLYNLLVKANEDLKKDWKVKWPKKKKP